MSNDKLDLFKTFKSDYIAPKKPTYLTPHKAQYLSVFGKGSPQEEAFGDAIATLYAAAYTTKMLSKSRGKDYVVCKLEAIWTADEGQSLSDKAMEEWNYQLIIRTPDFISKKELDESIDALKKKNKLLTEVSLRKLDEGKSIQMLHLGPYSEEPRTVKEMQAVAEKDGYQLKNAHHEIYLSDPRRVAPEKLKTILRYAIKR